MSEEPMRYGAGGVPYKGVPAPQPAAVEEIIEEPGLRYLLLKMIDH